MAIKKRLPVIPIKLLCFTKYPNNCVNTLLTKTSVISEAETPKINAIPPRWPLFRLCFIIEKITGPTDIVSNKPSVIPFKNASVMNQGLRTFKNLIYITVTILSYKTNENNCYHNAVFIINDDRLSRRCTKKEIFSRVYNH